MAISLPDARLLSDDVLQALRLRALRGIVHRRVDRDFLDDGSRRVGTPGANVADVESFVSGKNPFAPASGAVGG